MDQRKPGASTSPREFPGVCPGEAGCEFDERTATDSIAVYQARSVDSPVLFRLKKGDKVRGLDAHLVVKKMITCTTKGAVEAYSGPDKQVKIPSGTQLSLFYYEGEGYFASEYNQTQIGVCCLGETLECPEDRPEEELWLKVRSKSGRVGWSNARGKFHGTSRYDD